ncbi:MAG: hypothetical protein Q9166_006235 [cf. Caloplaca sp. 2 TL-2023]
MLHFGSFNNSLPNFYCSAMEEVGIVQPAAVAEDFVILESSGRTAPNGKPAPEDIEQDTAPAKFTEDPLPTGGKKD